MPNLQNNKALKKLIGVDIKNKVEGLVTIYACVYIIWVDRDELLKVEKIQSVKKMKNKTKDKRVNLTKSEIKLALI